MSFEPQSRYGSAVRILYRDADFIVMDKPVGWVVHRSFQARDSQNCMTRLRDELGHWVYPLHRLDRGTSGCLMFALNVEAAQAANRIFKEKRVIKRYAA